MDVDDEAPPPMPKTCRASDHGAHESDAEEDTATGAQREHSAGASVDAKADGLIIENKISMPPVDPDELEKEVHLLTAKGKMRAVRATPSATHQSDGDVPAFANTARGTARPSPHVLRRSVENNPRAVKPARHGDAYDSPISLDDSEEDIKPVKSKAHAVRRIISDDSEEDVRAARPATEKTRPSQRAVDSDLEEEVRASKPAAKKARSSQRAVDSDPEEDAPAAKPATKKTRPSPRAVDSDPEEDVRTGKPAAKKARSSQRVVDSDIEEDAPAAKPATKKARPSPRIVDSEPEDVPSAKPVTRKARPSPRAVNNDLEEDVPAAKRKKHVSRPCEDLEEKNSTSKYSASSKARVLSPIVEDFEGGAVDATAKNVSRKRQPHSDPQRKVKEVDVAGPATFQHAPSRRSAMALVTIEDDDGNTPPKSNDKSKSSSVPKSAKQEGKRPKASSSNSADQVRRPLGHRRFTNNYN